jgi:hypothetical protein
VSKKERERKIKRDRDRERRCMEVVAGAAAWKPCSEMVTECFNQVTITDSTVSSIAIERQKYIFE